MKAKTYRERLWLYFALFAVAILGLLWLLQTVLLQSSYESMVARNVRAVAGDIASHRTDEAFEAWLDETAVNNSLLIFITDTAGQPHYATDEHSGVYAVQATAAPDGNGNPYRTGSQSWQLGQSHYLSLPSGFDDFLARLEQSQDGTVAYESEDGTAYIYGLRLGDEIVYISTALAVVGATVQILRVQLVWVSIASLALAFVLAWMLARRFAAPVSRIAAQAQRLSEGAYDAEGTKGFSAELDALSGALEQAAGDITEARAYQRDFLANISHDLRTPLTMIRGYAEMVRDISWRSDEKREADLNVIIREADRLTALVNDIVDFSGMESGAQRVKMKPFCFSDMAREAVRQFAPLCEQEGYVIETAIDDGLRVIGDQALLTRVLYNLIDNAVTHAGSDKRAGVRVFETGGCIRTEVRDRGEGIPEDVLPHVWDRYFRAAQRKRNKKGSGLGLAISREIIEAHKGRYGVESVPGTGSMFWFEIDSTHD